MVIDCSRNSRKQDQGHKCQDAISRETFPSGFHAPRSVFADSKRAVVPTDIRHFGSQAYSELLDIRRAGLHEHSMPCAILSFFPSFLSLSLSFSLCLSSFSLYLILPLILFSLLLSLALSHTVDLLGGGSHRYTSGFRPMSRTGLKLNS